MLFLAYLFSLVLSAHTLGFTPALSSASAHHVQPADTGGAPFLSHPKPHRLDTGGAPFS
jgi:hypothetical protein